MWRNLDDKRYLWLMVLLEFYVNDEKLEKGESIWVGLEVFVCGVCGRGLCSKW